MGDQKHHVVLFPFMAQGHLTPFLSLAELIQLNYPTYTITLVNTPRNIRNIKSSLPPTSTISLRSLPFNSSDHDLPPESDNTASLPFHLIINLLQASETLRPAFEQLIADITNEDGRPPLCIIADNFLGWTVSVARKLNIFHSVFVTAGAYGISLVFSLWKHLPHTLTTSEFFPLPNFPEVHLHRSQLPKHLLHADGTDSWSVFFRRQISFCLQSDSVLVNTVEEVEKTGLDLLRRLVGLPVWPVGPLVRLPSGSSSSSCIKWLDSHPVGSVLYVSFGSQNTIAASQMMALAKGLEASGTRFIWVIRPPIGFDINGEFRPEWLPDGFEERMGEGKWGLLVHGWAPQVEILSHASTGGFLSHCGWNSVLESLSQGVPIIGWPLTGDQLYNSKMLEEEVGVCVEVARGGMEVEMERVERVVGVVMGGGAKGREMGRKAGEIGEVMRAAAREEERGGKVVVGSSVKGLNEFFGKALSIRGGL